MRSSAAFVAIGVALAACCSGPESSPDARSAVGRTPAASPAVGPAPAPPKPSPSGDRHARAAARRAPVVKRIEGTLSDRDDRTLVVGRPGALPLTLRIAPGTSVSLDGRPARAGALPPGAEVRAAYRTGEGGRPTALTVEARRPAAGAPAPGGMDDRARALPAEEPPGSRPWEASPEPPDPGGG